MRQAEVGHQPHPRASDHTLMMRAARRPFVFFACKPPAAAAGCRGLPHPRPTCHPLAISLPEFRVSETKQVHRTNLIEVRTLVATHSLDQHGPRQRLEFQKGRSNSRQSRREGRIALHFGPRWTHLVRTFLILCVLLSA
jgi:hypothetical protein